MLSCLVVHLKVWGVVLAGGRSRRLGFDKAQLRVGRFTLLERALYTLRSVFDHVAVSGRERGGLESAAGDPASEWVPDEIEDQGPLGGLLTVLRHRPGEHVFALAVDLPGVTPGLVRWLLDRARERAVSGDRGVCYPRVDGVSQPLCGVWPAGLEHEIERALGAGERSVSTLLSSVGASAIDLPASHPVYRPDLLINLNDLGDLEAAGVTQRPALRTGGRP